MALKLTYNFKGVDGVIIPDAYFRITSVIEMKNPEQALLLKAAGYGTGTKYMAYVTLEIMKDKDKAILEVKTGYHFAYDQTINDNAIKQAYAAVKKYPDFVGAVDVND